MFAAEPSRDNYRKWGLQTLILSDWCPQEKRLPQKQRKNTCENREMVTYQPMASEGNEKMAMNQTMACGCGEKTAMNQKWKKDLKTTNSTDTLISICSLQNHEKINSCLHHPPCGPQWWVAERTNTASKHRVGAWGCKLYVCSNHQERAEYRPWEQSLVALNCYRCSQTTNSAKAVNRTANIFIHEHTWK